MPEDHNSCTNRATEMFLKCLVSKLWKISNNKSNTSDFVLMFKVCEEAHWTVKRSWAIFHDKNAGTLTR